MPDDPNDAGAVNPTADPKAADSKTADVKSDVRIQEAPNPDAAEVGRILLDSGYTKEQLNDLMEAPKALAAIRHQLQNDPAEFLKMLERTDPKTGERFLESMADTYVSRYADKGTPAGKSKDESQSDLMREIEVLREKTTRLETEQQRRDAAIALQAAQQRYNSRVDDLLGTKEIQDLNLTKSETKNLRARLNSELASDPSMVQRVSNGNFVDVPRTFKGIIEELANDRKAQSDAEKEKRERAERRGFPEFESGPNPFMNYKPPEAAAESWDATEDALAKVLGGGAR